MSSSERQKAGTFSLILSCLRLRHISVVLMCCRVSLASRKRSFSNLGAADAQAAAPKRSLSSSIFFNIPEDVQNRLNETLKSIMDVFKLMIPVYRKDVSIKKQPVL